MAAIHAVALEGVTSRVALRPCPPDHPGTRLFGGLTQNGWPYTCQGSEVTIHQPNVQTMVDLASSSPASRRGPTDGAEAMRAVAAVDFTLPDGRGYIAVATAGGEGEGSIHLVSTGTGSVVACVRLSFSVTALLRIDDDQSAPPAHPIVGEASLVVLGTGGRFGLMRFRHPFAGAETEELYAYEVTLQNHGDREVPPAPVVLYRFDGFEVFRKNGVFEYGHEMNLGKEPDDEEPDGTAFVPERTVWVTSAALIAEGKLLFVGFNIGVFQLWSMDGLEPVYSSRPLCKSAPRAITAQAAPHMEDDKTLHLFVSLEDAAGQCVATVNAFTLELEEMDHTGVKDVKETHVWKLEGGEAGCVSSGVLSMTWARMDQDGNPCFIVVYDTYGGAGTPQTYCEVVNIREFDGAENLNRMAFYAFGSHMNGGGSRLVHAHMNTDSARFFTLPGAMDPHPNGVSFTLDVLSNKSLVRAVCLGAQESALRDIAQNGPEAFLQPALDSHLEACRACGLMDYGGGQAEGGGTAERRLLDVCLKQHLVTTICDYIVSTYASNDENMQGEPVFFLNYPPSVIQWASNAFEAIRQSWSRFFVPELIDDFDESSKDEYIREIEDLSQRCAELVHILRAVLHRCAAESQLLQDRTQGYKEAEVNIQGDSREMEGEIEATLAQVEKMGSALTVVRWFVANDMVCQEQSVFSQFASLYQNYRGKRVDMFRKYNFAVRNMTGQRVEAVPPEACELFVDVIAQRCQPSNGAYPTTNLYDLIVLANAAADPMAGHALIFYFLLDLLECAQRSTDVMLVEERNNQVNSFASCFSLPQSTQRIVYGFKLLDTDTDPAGATVSVTDNAGTLKMFLGVDWTGKVMRTLYDQQHYTEALQVLRCTRPLVTRESAVLQMKIILSCGLVQEAFLFQRQCSATSSSYDKECIEALLFHLFEYCKQSSAVPGGQDNFRMLLRYPLDTVEEELLQKYLGDNNLHVMAMYYLQRGRYPAAMELLESAGAAGADYASLVEEIKMIMPPAYMEPPPPTNLRISGDGAPAKEQARVVISNVVPPPRTPHAAPPATPQGAGTDAKTPYSKSGTRQFLQQQIMFGPPMSVDRASKRPASMFTSTPADTPSGMAGIAPSAAPATPIAPSSAQRSAMGQSPAAGIFSPPMPSPSVRLFHPSPQVGPAAAAPGLFSAHIQVQPQQTSGFAAPSPAREPADDPMEESTPAPARPTRITALDLSQSHLLKTPPTNLMRPNKRVTFNAAAAAAPEGEPAAEAPAAPEAAAETPPVVRPVRTPVKPLGSAGRTPARGSAKSARKANPPVPVFTSPRDTPGKVYPRTPMSAAAKRAAANPADPANLPAPPPARTAAAAAASMDLTLKTPPNNTRRTRKVYATRSQSKALNIES